MRSWIDDLTFHARRNGKQFASYLTFIQSVQSGERAMVYGPDYVVLSRNAYDDLVDRAHRVTGAADDRR